MAKLQDGSKVYGSLIVDGGIVGFDASQVTGELVITSSGAIYPGSSIGVGPGNQNMILLTSGTAATYTFPTSMQVPGLIFKLTIISGGGQGGGSTAVAGVCGGGGSAGSVGLINLTVVAGVYTLTYTVGVGGTTGLAGATGQAGTLSSVTYNGVTYSGTGGAGGTAAGSGGTAQAQTGVLTGLTLAGGAGGPGGTDTASYHPFCKGGDTALKYGRGGMFTATSTGSTGLSASGYGAGGGGARSGTGVTARAGGAGGSGLIIIEY